MHLHKKFKSLYSGTNPVNFITFEGDFGATLILKLLSPKHEQC